MKISRTKRWLLLVVVTAIGGGIGAQSRHSALPGSPEAKALTFLAREVPAWKQHNGCFSCHNNGDAARASTLLPEIDKILRRKNMNFADFDHAPHHADDPDATSYCPRCHGMFLKGRKTCGDCEDMPLKSL